MMDPAMMAQMGGGAGGMPQLPGNVGIALDEYGRPFLVMRDQVIIPRYFSDLTDFSSGYTKSFDWCRSYKISYSCCQSYRVNSSFFIGSKWYG